jgi:hypothetical protein
MDTSCDPARNCTHQYITESKAEYILCSGRGVCGWILLIFIEHRHFEVTERTDAALLGGFMKSLLQQTILTGDKHFEVSRNTD